MRGTRGGPCFSNYSLHRRRSDAATAVLAWDEYPSKPRRKLGTSEHVVLNQARAADSLMVATATNVVGIW